MNPFDRINAANPMKRVGSLYDEFRAFAFKGSVIDLAVGVIIGAAFSKIIESLVKNIIMPLVSLIIPGDNGYVHWAVTIRGQPIPYGVFIGDVVNFLLVAFVLFLVIRKLLGAITRSRVEVPPVPVLTKDQELLIEIRDLLRNQSAAPLPPPADRPV